MMIEEKVYFWRKKLGGEILLKIELVPIRLALI